MKLKLKRNRTLSTLSTRNDQAFGEKMGIMGKIFGCWHKELSRPFTNQKQSYRVCLNCGARKHFDAENLKTFGPFYYPPSVSLELR